MMPCTATALLASLAWGAVPAPRVAVLIDDPGPSGPVRAQIEAALQTRGFEVIEADVSAALRKAIAPAKLVEGRVPEGLSVLEADAVIAGAASYGQPQEFEGIQSGAVSLTARLIDLGTGRTTTTITTRGRGLGIGGPALWARGAKQAVGALFVDARFSKALTKLGQQAGQITLIVQGLPDRGALKALRTDLERALAGAPVRELYFARGLGKLVLGGSKAPSMAGPDIADLIEESLPLSIAEVANTRIVATYDRSKTVRIHALVLQPRVRRGRKMRAANAADVREIGRYVATRIATFSFARASYQPGRLTRAEAQKRATAMGADVVVESELMGRGRDVALAIRIIDAKTGRPVHRMQALLGKQDALQAAETILTSINAKLPDALAKAAIGTPPSKPGGPHRAERATQPGGED